MTANLLTALRGLLEQIESLDDYSLTRDLEPYEAEACWEDAIAFAHRAISEASA
jgi:hypothetical protein